jgi:hypothetical protein
MTSLFEEFQTFLQSVSTRTVTLEVLEEKAKYIDHVRVSNTDNDETYR